MGLFDFIRKFSELPKCKNCGRTELNSETGWYCAYCDKLEFNLKERRWKQKTKTERKKFLEWAGFIVGDFVELKGLNDPSIRYKIIGFTPEYTRVIILQGKKKQIIDPINYIPHLEIKPRNENEANTRSIIKASKIRTK